MPIPPKAPTNKRKTSSEILSAYRMRLGEEFQWHVAVIGTPPPEEIDRRIIENLATGETVTLSDGVVQFLNKRREQAAKEGPYVEKHHYPRRRTRG
jgi:hypothetical protein